MWHNSNMPTFRQFFLAFFLISSFFWAIPARAQSFSAGDLLAAINALRASRGLPPYQRDGGLMAAAQQHSEYQAQIGQSTHVHSDGLSPSAHGVVENIAAGSAGSLTPSIIVNQIWADALHMNTMIGYETGFAGVGIAVSGGTVYVTLNVRPGQSAATLAPSGPPQGGPTGAPAATQAALAPIVTATPGLNGLVVHEVGFGQSLWGIAIAYGVKIDDIRTLNGLAPGSTDIYTGQKLVIRRAGDVSAAAAETSATLSPTNEQTVSTVTPPPPPSASPPTDTPTPTASAAASPTLPVPVNTPTAAAVSAYLSGFSATKILGVGLIVVGAIGVAGVLVSSFKRKR